jgi:hypothetical protein
LILALRCFHTSLLERRTLRCPASHVCEESCATEISKEMTALPTR